MIDVSRRGLVVGATAASLAFGLDGPLEIMPSAWAQGGSGAPPFHRLKVGDLEVTTIYDGFNSRPMNAAFVRNATLDQTQAALKAAGLPPDPLTIPFTITIVRTGGRTVMFDSGTGAQLAPTAGLLMANMAAAGIDPGKIDTIVVTHCHPDHIFGLMAKETNAQVFPNAQIVMPKAELAFWSDPGVFTRIPETAHGLAKRIQATLPTWKNVTLVEGEREVAPGIRAIPAFGHTPGHTVYALGSAGAELLVLADTANVPALFVRNPGWHVMFDSDGAAAEAVRRRLFDRAITDKAMITGYHFGMPGIGRIERDGAGYAFVPVA